MFKKLLILVFTVFTFTMPAVAVGDTDIIAAAALYAKQDRIPAKGWCDAFNDKSAFVQWDINRKNKFNVYLYLGLFAQYLVNYDGSGTTTRYEFVYYDNGVVEQLNLENDIALAIYKISGDTIYQYENKRFKKPGLLGFLGFYEYGPGAVIATCKITDDTMTKYDANGNKLLSFKITEPLRVSLFDANDKKIGYYQLLTDKDITPKLTQSSYVPDKNSPSIVPVIILLAKSGIIKNEEWTDTLNSVSSVYSYNNHKERTGSYNAFSTDAMYQYDEYNVLIARFDAFSEDVYYYDGYNAQLGYFSMFGDDIYQYDKNNAEVGHYSFWGTDLYQYDRDYKKIGSFSIFGSSISQYDRYGKKIAEFDLF